MCELLAIICLYNLVDVTSWSQNRNKMTFYTVVGRLAHLLRIVEVAGLNICPETMNPHGTFSMFSPVVCAGAAVLL
jgi:hypothetical protein